VLAGILGANALNQTVNSFAARSTKLSTDES